MAMDMNADTRKGLRGFAIKRGVSGQPQTFLRGIKFFEELVPHHDPKQDFSSRDQPFQTFLWSDYHASPGTSYDFTIIALYGDIRAFEERHTLAFRSRPSLNSIRATASFSIVAPSPATLSKRRSTISR